MKKNKGVDRQSVPKGIGIGTLVSLVVSLIGTGIYAWMLSREHVSENGTPYATVIILLMSTVLGSVIANGVVKEKRLVVSLLASAGYLLVLLACTALFFGGRYQGVGVTALVVLAGSGSVALIGAKSKNAHTKNGYKYRNR